MTSRLPVPYPGLFCLNEPRTHSINMYQSSTTPSTSSIRSSILMKHVYNLQSPFHSAASPDSLHGQSPSSVGSVSSIPSDYSLPEQAYEPEMETDSPHIFTAPSYANPDVVHTGHVQSWQTIQDRRLHMDYSQPTYHTAAYGVESAGMFSPSSFPEDQAPVAGECPIV
ncbi:hypothetical protein K474DRAFT_832364 [Panus rudis PR-1116 ss-1]|nr:hypothetical protein K474DRAFT_832364 [Panus rudis PR-1116 ss-1]